MMGSKILLFIYLLFIVFRHIGSYGFITYELFICYDQAS